MGFWEADCSLNGFYVLFEETRADGSGLDENQNAVTHDVPALDLNRGLGSLKVGLSEDTPRIVRLLMVT